jgi:hypothetical protein
VTEKIKDAGLSFHVGRPSRVTPLTAEDYSLKMTNQLRLPRATRIGMLITLFLLTYLAGKFSELPGNAEWWIFKVCSVTSNAVLILLIWDVWKRDA